MVSRRVRLLSKKRSTFSEFVPLPLSPQNLSPKTSNCPIFVYNAGLFVHKNVRTMNDRMLISLCSTSVSTTALGSFSKMKDAHNALIFIKDIVTLNESPIRITYVFLPQFYPPPLFFSKIDFPL